MVFYQEDNINSLRQGISQGAMMAQNKNTQLDCTIACSNFAFMLCDKCPNLQHALHAMRSPDKSLTLSSYDFGYNTMANAIK